MAHHRPHHHHNSHASQNTASEPKPLAGEPVASGDQSLANRIRLRAYEISQARNSGQSNPLADWVQAEQELRSGIEAKR